MCLAIPGKVVELTTGGDLRMGRVSFGGVEKQVCLEWVPDVAVGEYVIVHVGFAISKLDEKEAMETLRLIGQLDDLSFENPEEEATP